MGGKNTPKRYRIVPVSRPGVPVVKGAEFVVGPLDPPLLVPEFLAAVKELRRKGFPEESLTVSATTGEDGYTVLSVVPNVEAAGQRAPITPQIPKRTVRAAIEWDGT